MDSSFNEGLPKIAIVMLAFSSQMPARGSSFDHPGRGRRSTTIPADALDQGPARRERPRGSSAAERGQEFSSCDVACHVTPPVGGSFMQWGMIPRFHRAVCDQGRIMHPQRSMRVEHGHEYSPRYMHGSLAVAGSII